MNHNSSYIDLHLGASRKGRPFFCFLEEMISEFLDFLYPPECLVCQTSLSRNGWICPDCESHLQSTIDIKSQSNPEDFLYLSDSIYFNQIVTCWPYAPEIEALVHHVKYHKGWRLGIRLGEMMGRVLSRADVRDADCLIPVPLHPIRLRERGYNQSFLYCKGLHRIHPIPILSKGLKRIRQTPTQTHLDADARQANVSRAFRVRDAKSVHGKRVLLVDDVATTGATMNACARALVESGAKSVTGLAFVRPGMRFSPTEMT